VRTELADTYFQTESKKRKQASQNISAIAPPAGGALEEGKQSLMEGSPGVVLNAPMKISNVPTDQGSEVNPSDGAESKVSDN